MTTQQKNPKVIPINNEDDNNILNTFIDKITKLQETTNTSSNTTIHNHYHLHHYASPDNDKMTTVCEKVEEITEIIDGIRNLAGFVILCICAYGIYLYGGHTFIPMQM